jgi:hypothetical protein
MVLLRLDLSSVPESKAATAGGIEDKRQTDTAFPAAFRFFRFLLLKKS